MTETATPVDTDTDGPHDWDQIRADAIAELTAVLTNLAPEADAASVAPALADAVLAVCEDEAINRMADHFVQKSGFRAMQATADGGVRMELAAAQEIIATWVMAARGALEDAGAINYIVIPVGFDGSAERYEFVLQRIAPGKLTPHQARVRAEGQVAVVRDIAARHPRSAPARQIRAYLDQAGQ